MLRVAATVLPFPSNCRRSSGFLGTFEIMKSVVIPLLDESENLPTLLSELDRVFAAMADKPHEGASRVEYIFVDDGSQDGSWSMIQQMAKENPKVRGIRLRRNFGKAAALTAGFKSTRGEIVFTLDGDLQDDPAEIPRFLEKINEGYDIVSGWKRTRFDPWHKVYPSRVFNWVVSQLTGCNLHDHNCGFKVYRREVLKEVSFYGELYRFVPVLAHAKGFRVARSRSSTAPDGSALEYGINRYIKGFLDLMTVRFLTGFDARSTSSEHLAWECSCWGSWD